MIQIRDGRGHVFNTVVEPAVVFDSDTGTLHKIGEKNEMEVYLQEAQLKYRQAGYVMEANSLMMMSLPADQNLVDDIFQITGFLRTFYRKSLES